MKNDICIDELRKIQMGILLEVDRFCERKKITYYLAYGTLLGAIRHKGYIPWDDDIDIWMPRHDYEVFHALFEVERHSHLKLFSYRGDENYKYPFIKVCDDRTILFEGNENDAPIGVWVDVFPLDNLPSDQIKRTKVFDDAMKQRKIWRNKMRRIQPRSNKFLGFFQNLGALFYTLMYKRHSMNDIVRKIDQVGIMANTYAPSSFCGNVVWGSGRRDCFPAGLFKNSIKVKFENHEFWAPAEYDQCLRTLYGDYMTLPPVSERGGHIFTAFWK